MSIKSKQGAAFEKSTGLIPAANSLGRYKDQSLVLTPVSFVETYKLKLLGDIASSLWSFDSSTRAMVFDLTQHIDDHRVEPSDLIPKDEDWGSIEEYLLDFLVKELHKNGYVLLFNTYLGETGRRTKILITWGYSTDFMVF